MGGARAAAGRARAAAARVCPPARPTPGLRLRRADRGRLLLRHPLLDRRRDGRVRRSAEGRGRAGGRPAGGLPVDLSRACSRWVTARAVARDGTRGTLDRARSPGRPRSSCVATCSPGSPGSPSATARRRCCPSRRWRASEASQRCLSSSRWCRLAWRTHCVVPWRRRLAARWPWSAASSPVWRPGGSAGARGVLTRDGEPLERRHRAGQHPAGTEVGRRVLRAPSCIATST